MEKLFLCVDNLEGAKNILRKNKIEFETSFMCLGAHFVPHEGIVFTRTNLNKIHEVLGSGSFKSSHPIMFKGAQLNL